ncbi:MAG: response regulator transcription factor [Lentimicrobiaceae bacterium]|nr:response regulator transcription factor [Lentimicrobiaceae bacterium]
MITVHITDDHKMLVEGLRLIINELENITITGVSYCIEECRQALTLQTPDILLLDLNLPDESGIDFCREVHNKYPQIKILILTTHSECSIAKQVIENGASGYILKNALSEEVIAGMEAVMQGELFLCDEIDMLIKKRTEEQIWLTAREKDILHYIAKGFNNKEMADKMFLSIHTIKTYRKNLIQKVGAKNSMILVKMAIENQWI